MPGCEDVPDGAFKGWSRWAPAPAPSFHDAIGPFQWQRRSPHSARCLVETGPRHGNGLGILHGGFISACIDMALFAAAEPALDTPAVTSQLAVDFLGAGTVGAPLELEAELLSESPRRLFVRVLVRQGSALVASASGTLTRVR